MAIVSSQFHNLAAFSVAVDATPAFLDTSPWDGAFTEFFSPTNVVSASVNSPTSGSGTISSGVTELGTFTVTGINLGTATARIYSIVYSDHFPEATLTINSTAGFTSSGGRVSGTINAIIYDRADDTYSIEFHGSASLTGSTFSLTSLTLTYNNSGHSGSASVSGSFSANLDTGALSGTIFTYDLTRDGVNYHVTGLSAPANAVLNPDAITDLMLETMLAGADTINSMADDQALHGFAGNDIYVFDAASTSGIGLAIEELNGGLDTVRTDFDYTLDLNVENAMLLAGEGTSLTGNHLTNALTGNANNNTLDGARGKDVLIGAAGDDTYYADLLRVGTAVSLEDTVTEALNGGTDTLNVRARSQDSMTFAIRGVNDTDVPRGEETFTRVVDPSNALVGSWLASEPGGGGTAVLTFLSDGSYTFAQDGADDDPSGHDGMEQGTFAWDPESHDITMNTPAVDTNGDWGVSNFIASSAVIAGNTLTLSTDAGDLTWTRVTSPTYPLAGGWSMGSGEGLFTLTFLNVVNFPLVAGAVSGDYMMVHANGVMGIEHASFQWFPNQSNPRLFITQQLAGGLGASGLAFPFIDSATIDLAIPDSTSYAVVLPANVENLDLTLAGNANLRGTGNALNNTLTGSAGNNFLDGMLGNDTYVGSAGNDTYVLAQALDNVTGADAGTDTVRVALATSPWLDISGHADLENVAFIGSGAVTIVGNASANVLTGGASNDNINGGIGADTMNGGAGNDTFTVDNAGDLVNDASGIDTVSTFLTGYILGPGIENLTATGDEGMDATGNNLANIFTGNGAVNTFTGLGGNDTYIFQNSADMAVEAAGVAGGIDTVRADASFNLAVGGANVENLILTGEGGWAGHGNSLLNTITGNAAGNYFDGVQDGFADKLIGGGGDDTYLNYLVRIGTAAPRFEDMVSETSATGGTHDQLVVWLQDGFVAPATAFMVLLPTNVEDLDLSNTGAIALNATGSAANNLITGNAGNNTILGMGGNDMIDGFGGTDILDGGAGNDTYVADGGNATYFISDAGDSVNVGDVGNEQDADIDTLRVEILGNSYLDISSMPWFENVTFVGTGNATLVGNIHDNVITGGAGNDNLSGGSGGIDTLAGMGGNDTYAINHAGITINDSAGNDTYNLTGAYTPTINDVAGTDTVQALVSFTLTSGLENLLLMGEGGAINGAGNLLNNVLTGNSSANVLDTGGGGRDTLTGGMGADTFVIDHVANLVAALTDTITDFNQGQGDRIGLDATKYGALFTGDVLTDGVLRSAAGAASATNATQRLIYNQTNGYLYYDADGNATAAAPIWVATLSNHTPTLALQPTDFVLVNAT